jgi:hypothetical protein
MSWLDDLRRRLEREPEGLTPNRVVEIIQSGWAGEKVYIPSRTQLRPEIAPNDTPQTIQARYRVSRSTSYVWLRQWRR